MAFAQVGGAIMRDRPGTDSMPPLPRAKYCSNAESSQSPRNKGVPCSTYYIYSRRENEQSRRVRLISQFANSIKAQFT